MNVRERWAILTNEALRAANLAARVDHRSLAAQGAAWLKLRAQAGQAIGESATHEPEAAVHPAGDELTR